MNRLLLAAALLATFPSTRAEDVPKPAPSAATAQKNLLPDDAVAAWKEVAQATNPPLPPAEWNQKPPTDDEYAAFRLKMGESAAIAADKAKEFQARFAEHAHAADAKELRREMLKAAVSLGVKDRAAELAALGGEPAGTASATTAAAQTADPFTQRMGEAVAAARKLESQGMPAVFGEFERQLRAIQKEFPDRPEAFIALLEVAQGLGGAKGLALTQEVEAAKVPAEVKRMAKGMREQIQAEAKKLERVGQPLDLKFTAVDGRAVDLAALKGKVVLVDFWATWCGPCIAELPNVKAAYEKLHPKGFEIVGISFDQEKDALEAFVKKRGMPWAQYFDGEGWGNKFGREFGISGIPSMWLVDKQGKLRDLEARDGSARARHPRGAISG